MQLNSMSRTIYVRSKFSHDINVFTHVHCTSVHTTLTSDRRTPNEFIHFSHCVTTDRRLTKTRSSHVHRFVEQNDCDQFHFILFFFINQSVGLDCIYSGVAWIYRHRFFLVWRRCLNRTASFKRFNTLQNANKMIMCRLQRVNVNFIVNVTPMMICPLGMCPARRGKNRKSIWSFMNQFWI